MNQVLAPTRYVAIQQIRGVQPTNFLKLARPYTLEQLKMVPGGLELDKDWLMAHGYSKEVVQVNGSTSNVVAIESQPNGVVLLKTKNSVYQAIPDFS